MTEELTIESACAVRPPRILYGTAWKEQRTAACVELALKTGFRGVDTACQPKHYHEPGVGDGIAAFLASTAGAGCTREQLYVQTKFTPLSGQDPKRIPYDAHAPLPDQVAQSVQMSLANLHASYLDCVVLHSPLANLQATIAVWRALEQACERGYVRQIGISNCHEVTLFERICREARIQPSVLQNRFYAQSGYDRELRALCRARQIVYQSFWTLTANPHVLAHGSVTALSKKYQRTPAQVLFRYLTQEGIVPLTGTQSLQHMQEDLAIFDFELTQPERAAIATLF